MKYIQISDAMRSGRLDSGENEAGECPTPCGCRPAGRRADVERHAEGLPN